MNHDFILLRFDTFLSDLLHYTTTATTAAVHTVTLLDRFLFLCHNDFETFFFCSKQVSNIFNKRTISINYIEYIFVRLFVLELALGMENKKSSLQTHSHAYITHMQWINDNDVRHKREWKQRNNNNDNSNGGFLLLFPFLKKKIPFKIERKK